MNNIVEMPIAKAINAGLRQALINDVQSEKGLGQFESHAHAGKPDHLLADGSGDIGQQKQRVKDCAGIG